MRIVFCGESFPAASRHLREHLPQDEIVVAPQQELYSVVKGADAVVPLMCRVDAPLMDAGGFRLVQQWGAGLEGVDLDAARKRGIWVANVPASGSNADSVAELAIMLIIGLLRSLPEAIESVRDARLGFPIGRMLASRTVCLWGLGAMAGALAGRLRAFDVRLIGITREAAAAKAAALGLDACYSVSDRLSALAQTDVLVLCSRMSPESRGMVDTAALQAMPRGAVLVNAARGGLIDYHALYAALESGHLAGAGLDVYWTEPVPPGDPLLKLPNVIATPHIAGVTDRSYREIASVVSANIERLRRGDAPLHAAASA